MRALVTHEERRDAALDVANFLCDDGLELITKYPNGSTFTAVGLSENGDAVLHVELPDRSDAVERIPFASLQYLRPAAAERGLIVYARPAGVKVHRVAPDGEGGFIVASNRDAPKRVKLKISTIVRLGGSVHRAGTDPAAPAPTDRNRS